jgi:hypothetical protein
MRTFEIVQYLPVLNKNIKYNELVNKQMEIICKYIANSDDEGLAEYFDSLIYELLIDKTIFSLLTNIDKFFILLNLRSICVGNTIKFNSIDTQVSVSILLHSILDRFAQPLQEFNIKKNIDLGGLGNITVGIPRKMYSKDIDHISMNTIISCTLFDNDISVTDEIEIVDNLPAHVINDILSFIDEVSLTCEDKIIIAANSNAGIKQVILTPFGNKLFYFIKTIFSEDLFNFYKIYFWCMSKIGITSDGFYMHTPAETQLFIDMYIEDKKEENKMIENSQPHS